MSSINLPSFSPAPKSHSCEEQEAIASALKRAEQANIAPEAVEALQEADEIRKETAMLKKQADEALSRAQQVEKATEVLEGAYEALDKASYFMQEALKKEQAAKARLAALRERRRTPAPAIPASQQESEFLEQLPTSSCDQALPWEI